MKANIILVGPEFDDEFKVKTLDGSWTFFEVSDSGALRPMKVDGKIPVFQNEIKATQWITAG